MYSKKLINYFGWFPIIAVWVVASAVTADSAYAQSRALLIANSDYNPPGPSVGDLPGDVFDLLRKHNALENAGWDVVNLENLTATQITDAITANKPPTGEGKFYFVWYSGHGSTDAADDGDLTGVDGTDVTPQAFADALGDGNENRTFVKLDSCGSGAFADAVNLIRPGIGFQTAVTGRDCAPAGDGTGSPFSTCYITGLNGAADGAGGGIVDDLITVAEAAAYATANCNFGSAPQHDGDYPTLVIGALKTETGSCLLNKLCVQPISEAVCTEKGGVYFPEPDCPGAPAVSEWGLIVLTLLAMTLGTIMLARRRRPAVA